MVDVFATAPGAVVALDGPGIPMNLFIEGWEGYAGFKSIISGVQVATENGTQFLHTLRDFVYVYTFGERIGQMTVSGVGFAAQCETGDARFHGLEYTYAYYLEARASNLGRPITVTVGGDTTFFAFVTGMEFGVADAERALSTFSMKMNVVPVANQLLPDLGADEDEVAAEEEEE